MIDFRSTKGILMNKICHIYEAGWKLNVKPNKLALAFVMVIALVLVIPLILIQTGAIPQNTIENTVAGLMLLQGDSGQTEVTPTPNEQMNDIIDDNTNQEQINNLEVPILDENNDINNLEIPAPVENIAVIDNVVPVTVTCSDMDKFYGGKCMGELSVDERKIAENCLKIRKKSLELNVNWKNVCGNTYTKTNQGYATQLSGTELVAALNLFSSYQHASFDTQNKNLVVTWTIPINDRLSKITPKLLYYPNDDPTQKTSESIALQECTATQCTLKFSNPEDGTFFAIADGYSNDPIYFEGRSQIGVKKIEFNKQNILIFKSSDGEEKLSVTVNFEPLDSPISDEYIVIAYDDTYPEINYLITTTNPDLQLEEPATITLKNEQNEQTLNVNSINSIKINSNGEIK
jgi:hypothetical protein